MRSALGEIPPVEIADEREESAPPGRPASREFADHDEADRFARFDRDGLVAQLQPVAAPRQLIRASLFECPDPSSIRPRRWLHGRHYVRSYVSGTIASPGIGKSTLVNVEGCAMASGRDLLGVPVRQPLRVWILNLEDPREETERRLAAVCLHYGLTRDDLGDRLFTDSGRDMPITLAEKVRDRLVVHDGVADEIVREIRNRGIDVLIVDPFVSSHRVPENDNGAIDAVVKTWARIADECSCSIELIHHVRKPGNGQSGAFTVDDARGAGALIGAVRSARVLNVMTAEEAARADIRPEERQRYIRVDNGKANMQPPLEKAVWRKLISVGLNNATPDEDEDWVQVVTAWSMPGLFDGLSASDLRKVQDVIRSGSWAENVQASNWAGYAISQALDLPDTSAADKQRLKDLLRAWVASGALKIDRQHDARNGRDKPVVVVGDLDP
jgi:hypothetical protein